MLGVGANISEEVWKQIVNEIDENGDGEVSFEEFKMMMVQLLKDNWSESEYWQILKNSNFSSNGKY